MLFTLLPSPVKYTERNVTFVCSGSGRAGQKLSKSVSMSHTVCFDASLFLAILWADKVFRWSIGWRIRRCLMEFVHWRKSSRIDKVVVCLITLYSVTNMSHLMNKVHVTLKSLEFNSICTKSLKGDDEIISNKTVAKLYPRTNSSHMAEEEVLGYPVITMSDSCPGRGKEIMSEIIQCSLLRIKCAYSEGKMNEKVHNW